MGRSPLAAFQVYVIAAFERPLGAAGIARQGDAARPDRNRPLVLLSRQPLEHRRGGPVRDRRRLRKLARARDARIGRGRWVFPAMMLVGHRRRRALRTHSGLPENAVRRQRDPDEPDARLCRAAHSRLPRARPLARPEGLQLPAIRDLRSVRDAARRCLKAGRVHYGASFAAVAVLVTAIVVGRTLFGYRLRLTGDAPRAARFAGLQRKEHDACRLRDFGRPRGPCGHLRGRPARSGSFSPRSRPATGSRPSPWPFSAASIRSGSWRPRSWWRSPSSAARARRSCCKLPLDLTTAFQGMLLLCVLAADALVSYRIRLVGRRAPA